MRRRTLKRGLPTLAILFLAAYAFWIEPYQLVITELNQAAPAQATPIRIALLADLHLHQVGRREQAVIQQLQQHKPDLIVLAGDVIDRADNLPALQQFLQPLTNTPTVAIMGNWEYWSAVDRLALQQLYQQQKVTLLINQSVDYQIQQRQLEIVGLDDFTAGTPQLPTAMPDGHKTRLLLQHSPGWFDQTTFPAKQKFDLCLAGHTHGGQVTLFGYPVWTPPGSGHYTEGHYQTALCPLYISRGIGTSMLPIRFGARPELVIIDL